MTLAGRVAGAARLMGLCIAVGAMLLGCASPKPADLPTLAGRLSIRIEGQPERSLSAGFLLTGNAERGSLVLSGPLGTTAAQAGWSPGLAWLIADRGRVDYADLDALALAALGEAVPIAALFDWLRGQAWPAAASTSRVDGVLGFDQLGWRVDQSRWADGWVDAQRLKTPAVTVRVRLERN